MLILMLARYEFPQDKNQGPNFPYQEFSSRAQTAQWLLAYDWAAWKSSDIVLKAPQTELEKLGRDGALLI